MLPGPLIEVVIIALRASGDDQEDICICICNFRDKAFDSINHGLSLAGWGDFIEPVKHNQPRITSQPCAKIVSINSAV
ncbi:hypothetical protein K678_16490 [Magnetospirillum fulvum MGU-K5]|uniref:Uncharacterized protein n=1 Tax=Magnetospirillum fulvum MGU-K5 TaxID=1316936 RepID=S9TP34_MAGFU|nr:hypothetical protein K678_16490 [Magnetospirillum fulvum MGU-K5]